MNITILGCGNAFSKLNFNQSYLLEENGRKMCIDYGWQAPYAMRNAGIFPKDIDDFYISHLHADHIGGLEEVAFTCYDWKNRPKRYSEAKTPYAPKLYSNDQMLKNLWEKSLRGGLESMEGFVATLETYFEPMPIPENGSFEWEGWTCRPVQQVHILSGTFISYTFGLIMKKEGHETVYFTLDTQHASPGQIEFFYKEADSIFQDCECAKIHSGVHAHYSQLAGYPEANAQKLSEDVKAKMWLTHYQDIVTEGKDYEGNPCDWQERAKNDGFKGFVTVGQTFTV